MNHRPTVAITTGDPAGIGPEICLKLLAQGATAECCVPLVFGDAEVLHAAAAALDLPVPTNICAFDNLGQWRHAREPLVVDFQAMDATSVVPGHVNAATGSAAYRYIMGAIEAALAGDVDAICTGPINKHALHAAGFRYPGHTELLAEKTKTSKFCMMLTAKELSCCFVTSHIGFADVPTRLTTKRIVEVIQLGTNAMRRLRGREPRLIVCGLNPHAGERGLLGRREEERIIMPAIEWARQQDIEVDGPVPPDTAFLPARRAQTDLFVCMYHDQGHIPMKALAFDVAVNVTLGLPIVRTSVDHGTACEIAGQGTAQITSLIEAVRLAALLSAGRRDGLAS